MTALADATIEQMGALRGLTEALVEVDRALSGVLAVKEGLLAVGARLAADMAGDGDPGAELSLRSVAAEFATALRVSDRTVQARMAEAEMKVSLFPEVWKAQGAGRISSGHARVILDAGMYLDDEASRHAYAEQMIAFAETESPNRVGRLARRVAERFQARTADERHRVARRERRVWVTEAADGMAQLGLLGPAALVQGAFSRLTAMAERVQNGLSPDGSDSADAATDPVDSAASSPDDRRIDEIRCDLALDLMLSGAPAGHDTREGVLAAIAGHVSVTVPVLTLMGVDDAAAEIDGRMPVDTATARRLAGASAGWERILTHPVTGGVLAVDRYRPSADMIRYLKSRDVRCRFPGCGRAAADCDVDHTADAALGGATSRENLGDLCRRHHVLKHHSPWQVEQLGGGVFAWTSPTGKTYIDHPPPQNTVTFTDADGPPPF
ncbi:HNH endonuclease signature motif containing protein [Microbacterium sp. XT11]|uniref:HNH endonuclease signature motif containing protein n=1 Tax=Microbacterium sp. XT11 TaxID=367477 RepID=UPI000742E2A6|nr:HNH endonuclease signature motif containing protein [Microbacterium sp. XT11]ALX65868.1 hypothetical protein AB663_000636 [Microbacterium sp. XT11]